MYGIQGKHPTVIIDYSKWGQQGDLSRTVTSVQEPDVQQAIALVEQITDLTGFDLVSVGKAMHYRGEHQALPIVHLRFEPSDQQGIGGAHISATVNTVDNSLIGLVRMLPELAATPEQHVTHQQAIDTAFAFLNQYAPDLMPDNIEAPELNQLPNGSRMEFSEPHINKAKVQVRWIDAHPETLFQSGAVISGMKVKMYLPETGLWCWVIVDKHNQVMVFERDISWNFEIMQRNTPMWLHDAWLQANHYM